MNIVRTRDHMASLSLGDVHAPIQFSDIFNVAVSFIDRHVEEGRGTKVALIAEEQTVTYGQLAENVARSGNALKSLGLAKQDRVLIVSVDSPEFFYVFWGAIKAGFIPIPVNTRLKEADYQHLIDDSGCVAAYVDCPSADEVLNAAKHSSLLPAQVLTKDSLKRLMRHASDRLEPVEMRHNDDCFWLYSSGSTGKPKGVVHTHKDMVVTSMRYGMGILGITQDDIVFCASKLFFSYGFGGGMTCPLWAGASIVISDELPSAEMAFRMIEAYKPTVYFGVPTLYRNQLQAAERKSYDLSSIRVAASAGEHLPISIYEKWKEQFGMSILDGIGSSEVLLIFVSNRLDDVKPGTSGKPVDGYEVKIVDDSGATLGAGEVGTLMVKGQSNARCYWNNPEKTMMTMRGEWLNTGDMYSYDEDGYYINAGRSDDMIKVGGMWCSPLEIEATLLTHPKVSEVAVVGQDDVDGLQKPAAFIVLRNTEDEHEATELELQKFCKERLAGYKYPRWFKFLDQLPKTDTGKLQRYRLR